MYHTPVQSARRQVTLLRCLPPSCPEAPGPRGRAHLVSAQVIEVEHHLLRQVLVLTPQHPANARKHQAILVARHIDALHVGQTEAAGSDSGGTRRQQRQYTDVPLQRSGPLREGHNQFMRLIMVVAQEGACTTPQV
jgi:hypothetical protein